MSVSESTRHLHIKTIALVFSAPKAIVADGLARDVDNPINEGARQDLDLEAIKTTIGIIPSQIF